MSGCIADTETVDLTVLGGVLTADVKVSADAGNELGVHADGLFATGAPTGAVLPYAAAAAPSGWLLCDGSNVNRVTYAALFALIGTTYGVGDGSTTFGLPDVRGRMIAGFAAAGGHADVSALGDNEGSAEANRRPKHPHTDNINFVDTGHIHGERGTDVVLVTSGGGTGHFTTLDGNDKDSAANTDNGNAALSKSGAVGVAGTASDTPAYLVLNHIIKT